MNKKTAGGHSRLTVILFAFICLLAFWAAGCTGVKDAVEDAVKTYLSGEQGGGVSTGAMKVYFFDVGQGDSQLIACDGHYMLVDAGEPEEGQRVVRYLKALGVKKLDYIIGTHPHSDHIGGMAAVLKAFDVENVMIPPVENTTRSFEDMLDAAEDQGLKLTAPEVGAVYDIGSASFEILSPGQDYGDDLNNWSIGVRITYGNNHFLMCGDAEQKAEHDMIAAGLDLRADVLKAGHHGSSTSSSDEFLDEVRPSYAVISCEEGNSYGHPHRETIERLEQRNIQIFRTDQDGTVTAVSDGTHIDWETGEGGGAGVYDSGGYGAGGREGAISGKTETTGEKETAEDADIPKESEHDPWDDAAGSEAGKGGDYGWEEPGTEIIDETLESEDRYREDAGETAYILNTNTKKFHKPSCSSVDSIKDKNKEEFTGDREELLDQGYSPCGNCKP